AGIRPGLDGANTSIPCRIAGLAAGRVRIVGVTVLVLAVVETEGMLVKVKVTPVPVVTLLLSVAWVAEGRAVTKVPAGMPAPVTDLPTTRLFAGDRLAMEVPLVFPVSTTTGAEKKVTPLVGLSTADE